MHLSNVWFKLTDLQIVSGEGSWLTTDDGARYLDFTSGIAVTSTGHCHPHVVGAIQRQAGRLIHGQANVFTHDLLEPLAAKLTTSTPGEIDTFFFTNSGAEAVEASVKLARQATGRPHIVVVDGSFHGRTAMTMAMTTSKSVYRAGHAPLPSGVFVAPWPSADDPVAVTTAVEGFERLLATQTAPAETAAFVIEPVLGEGGYRPAPPDYLSRVTELCRRHGILVVADEVQTGFGRTGKMFACEHYDLEPDVIVMAKGAASGFPFAAVGARRELMDRWPQGSHGGTYGGNPIACAAALATIEVIEAEGLVGAAAANGQRLRTDLELLSARNGAVSGVRGLGLMVAFDIVDAEGRPNAERTSKIIAHASQENRVLFMTAGWAGNTFRLMPPLTVTDEELGLGLNAIYAGVAATERRSTEAAGGRR